MLFNSLPFAVFLAIVLCLYYPLPHRLQNPLLLAASCIFYACWDWRFLLPLLLSTSIDYVCAMKMQQVSEHGQPHSRRKRFLYISVVTNLLLLGFFKYFNFFSVSLDQLLQHAGLHVSPWTLRIILPVGISFYTFQALSYTIDVYRGQLHSTDSYFDFLLAVLFFPHLVAGPIQRAHNLLPQVTNPRVITRQKISDGIHLIVCGFFKKVFLADNIAPTVNHIFSLAHPSGFQTVMAAYAFAIQIYCDFSGYTDIARGVAKIMGFEFMLNFNLPYLAVNPSDFWRRWHISLSTWLRDYLFIPLGGSRGREWKINRNLLLTMVIGGLWHGAAWNFVLWGFFHGILLVAHRACAPGLTRFFRASSPTAHKLSVAFRALLMFQFTAYGWLLFRADSLAQVRTMTASLLHPFAGYDPVLLHSILLFAAPLVVVQIFQYTRRNLHFLDFAWLPTEARTVVYAVAAYFVFFLGGTQKSFIYFQF